MKTVNNVFVCLLMIGMSVCMNYGSQGQLGGCEDSGIARLPGGGIPTGSASFVATNYDNSFYSQPGSPVMSNVSSPYYTQPWQGQQSVDFVTREQHNQLCQLFLQEQTRNQQLGTQVTSINQLLRTLQQEVARQNSEIENLKRAPVVVAPNNVTHVNVASGGGNFGAFSNNNFGDVVVGSSGSNRFNEIFNFKALLSTVIILTALSQKGPEGALLAAGLVGTSWFGMHKLYHNFSKKIMIASGGSLITALALVTAFLSKDADIVRAAVIMTPISLLVTGVFTTLT